MPEQLANKVFTGARAKVVIGDVEVGYATQISVNVNYNNLPVEVCGDPIAKALVLVGVNVDISIGTIRLVGPDEDTQAKGLVPKFNASDLLDWPEVDLLLLDSHNDDQVQGKAIGCRIASETLDVTARGLAGRNIRMQGREFHHASDS